MFGRLGDVLGASRGRRAAVWGVLRCLLGFMVRFSGNFSRSCGEDGRSWWQVAPKMGHDSAKVGQDGAKMVSFSLTCEVFDTFWEDLGTGVG